MRESVASCVASAGKPGTTAGSSRPLERSRRRALILMTRIIFERGTIERTAPDALGGACHIAHDSTATFCMCRLLVDRRRVIPTAATASTDARCRFGQTPNCPHVARVCYGRGMFDAERRRLATMSQSRSSRPAPCPGAALGTGAGRGTGLGGAALQSAPGDRWATGGDSKFLHVPRPALRLRFRVGIAGDRAATPAVLTVPMVA